MDAVDRAILHELQNDGRISNQDLADRVGLSPSPCLRRVKLLESSGVITGYRADISAKALGLPITVFVELVLDRHTNETTKLVEDRIRSIENVIECHVLAGDADYLLKVAIGSLEEYENLIRSEIRSIPSISSVRTSFAYAKVKEHSPLPTDTSPRRR